MTTDAATYSYVTGEDMQVGDLVLIGDRTGIWVIYHLGTFPASPADAQIHRPERQYASVRSTSGAARRTAADISALRLVRRAA